jgi:MFS family permease
LIVVSAPALIFQRFERNELGSAMGLFSLNMPAATVISFNVLGAVASQYGWRFSIFCTVVVNISALILCFISKDGGRVKPEKIDLAPLRKVNIWILGLIWALFNMAAIGYTTWGKTIFIRFDWIPIALSDLVASLLMLGAFIAPLTGLVSDRLGKRRPLIIISCLCMSGIFLTFPYIQKIFLVPLALTLGLLAAFLPPALFALPEELLGKGKGGIGLGVLNTFLNLGVIIGPFTIGYVLDFTDSGHLSFFVMAFFVLLASLLAFILKAR